jgi:3-hydroxyanthranilate 3,4-dioxygenase
MAAPAEMPLPLAFSSWLSENGASLTPPVSNRCLYSGKDFVLMVVGGPNTRNDFHGMSTYLTAGVYFNELNNIGE